MRKGGILLLHGAYEDERSVIHTIVASTSLCLALLKSLERQTPLMTHELT